MQKFDTNSLAPSRIGQLLDRSLTMMPRLLSRKLLIAYLGLSLLAVLQAYFNQQLELDSSSLGRTSLLEIGLSWFGVAVFGISISVAELYTSVWVVYRASDVWLSRSIVTPSPPPGTLKNTFRVALLTVYIFLVTVLYFGILVAPAALAFIFLGGAFGVLAAVALGTLGGLLAIAYLLNRTLSSYPLLLENLSIKQALQRSKSLMTFYPNMNWYSFGTPTMRLSGILLVTTTLGTIPAMVFGASSTFSSIDFRSTLINAAALILLFIGRFFILVFGSFTSMVMVSFYYDLRARTEGFDILQELQQLKDSSAINLQS